MDVAVETCPRGSSSGEEKEKTGTHKPINKGNCRDICREAVNETSREAV